MGLTQSQWNSVKFGFKDVMVVSFAGGIIGLYNAIYTADKLNLTDKQQEKLDSYFNLIIYPNSVLCGAYGCKLLFHDIMGVSLSKIIRKV